MIKLRSDYQFERNERIYNLTKDGRMSINDIVFNPALNPERLSQQRISKIVQVHRYLESVGYKWTK